MENINRVRKKVIKQSNESRLNEQKLQAKIQPLEPLKRQLTKLLPPLRKSKKSKKIPKDKIPYEIDQLQTKLDKIRQIVIMANQKKQKKLSRLEIEKIVFDEPLSGGTYESDSSSSSSDDEKPIKKPKEKSIDTASIKSGGYGHDPVPPTKNSKKSSTKSSHFSRASIVPVAPPPSHKNTQKSSKT